MNKPAKQRKCDICPTMFTQINSLNTVCGLPCAIIQAENKRVKKAKRELKEIKRDIRKRKQALKTKSQWLADAQNNAFNPYIRKRDEKEPCISCGRYEHEITERYTGGIWDCGHYLTRGAYPELRFSELNAHKQCKSCNGGAGKYVKKNLTVTQQYRINLINKIGIKNVEWLEGAHKAQNLSIEDIQEIKKFYKQQLKLISSE